MKLNAGIIFEHLKESFDAELLGQPKAELALPRPVFYMDEQTIFQPNTLYLASADHLPPRPTIKDEAVIVCVGTAPQLARYISRCTVIRIAGSPDFFSVYLDIQKIFDRYDAWNDRLFDMFRTDADMQKIVEVSSEALGNPIMVIDRNFSILAASQEIDTEKARLWIDKNEQLSQYAVEKYLSNNELQTDIHEPLFLKGTDSNSLNVNLFDRQGTYIGCLIILIGNDEPRTGFDALAAYLARIVETSIEKNPAVLSTEHAARKGVLKDVIAGRPIGPNQRWLLESQSEGHRYACVTLHAFDQEQTLPATFICNSFEMLFPGSYALPHESTVIGIIELHSLGDDADEQRQRIEDALGTLVRSLKLSAGVSYGFSSLYDTPIYVGQAESALDNGGLMKPGESIFFFADLALVEMVINSLAGSPIESLISDELAKVVEHDASSSISYLETLRVFLAENMNYSKVAGMLFIHRSTLIDRIEKIERMGLDLHDSDTRLYLQLILKAMEIGDMFKQGI